jgi:phosphocarrier protein
LDRPSRKWILAIATREIEIVNKYGLHARPAMQLVELANNYQSKIEVTKDTLTVDAKSIMSVMRLAATKGTKLTIVSDGDDADEAADALAQLISGGFGEFEQAES